MKRKHVITAAAAAVGVAAVAVAGTAIAPAAGLVGVPPERAAFTLAHGGGWSIEGWIAFVEAELEITEAQRPQWEALAAAIRENVGAVQDAFERRHASLEADDDERQSAVERLAAFEGLAEAGLAALRKVSPPFKALYAVLGEEQQERADRLLDHRGKRRWMRH
jgi:Spy/CpxP family protein refolding chaperone